MAGLQSGDLQASRWAAVHARVAVYACVRKYEVYFVIFVIEYVNTTGADFNAYPTPNALLPLNLDGAIGVENVFPKQEFHLFLTFLPSLFP
jgi:hypothetical protein